MLAVLEHKVLKGEPLPGPFFIFDTYTQMSGEWSAHIPTALQAEYPLKKNHFLKSYFSTEFCACGFGPVQTFQTKCALNSQLPTLDTFCKTFSFF